ncbi:MAG: type II toxin-antitoxin system RelE/ParE family toxin [Thiotrichaceae bacterium]|nr:type II toxin-antitoxin system RelE/ParE family toxin [Thiotrichaceae bacterium]
MRIFKTKLFHQWACKEGLNDTALCRAVDEIERGLIDANLGGRVFKKRVAIQGRGKSGGLRALLAFKHEDKAFFIYGFAKHRRANIKVDELKALKRYASELPAYSHQALTKACASGVQYEVENNG